MLTAIVLYKYISLLPLLMTKLLYRLVIGKKAPPMHKMLRISALVSHFSVIRIVINSLEIIQSPNIRGKAMNAVNLSIFLKTRNCLA